MVGDPRLAALGGLACKQGLPLRFRLGLDLPLPATGDSGDRLPREKDRTGLGGEEGDLKEQELQGVERKTGLGAEFSFCGDARKAERDMGWGESRLAGGSVEIGEMGVCVVVGIMLLGWKLLEYLSADGAEALVSCEGPPSLKQAVMSLRKVPRIAGLTSLAFQPHMAT